MFVKKLLITALFAFILAAIIWFYISSPVSNSSTIISVNIPVGFNSNQIASKLKTAGLIKSKTAFKLTANLYGYSNKLKPGNYQLNQSMNLLKIIEIIAIGKSKGLRLTVPEGYTIRQIADKISSLNMAKIDVDAFVAKCFSSNNYPQFQFTNDKNLEGYLFPDTYLINPASDIDTLIETMLENFKIKVVEPLKPDIIKFAQNYFPSDSDDFSISLNKVIILASLVEREARKPSDRTLIASVILNRLKNNMRLEICATVSYMPGESRGNKSKIYIADTKKDSPFNTYLHSGLPPAPICNPGLASIKAVLNPSGGDYLYYVAKPDGSHIFSRTYAQHLAAKRLVR